MLFGVYASCRIFYSIVSYLYVSCSGQLPRLRKREIICLLSFSCNYVVSVWRDFLFLLMLVMGCVIFLWHSLYAFRIIMFYTIPKALTKDLDGYE